MSWGDADLENFILSTIDRWTAGRYVERHALVTSYDADNHLGKVMFQPEGFESGWLPIEEPHIGGNYGMVVGLQPGDGKSTGDQVIVRMQEGDVESAKIAMRVHSTKDKPPKVQAGEMMLYTRFTKSGGEQQGAQGGTGQQIYLKNDGSLTLTDGNGFTLTGDGSGNGTLTTKNMTHNINGDHTVNITGKKTVTINGKRSDSVGGSWVSKAAGGVWSWLTSGSDSD